jgi:hypothetical protein
MVLGSPGVSWDRTVVVRRESGRGQGRSGRIGTRSGPLWGSRDRTGAARGKSGRRRLLTRLYQMLRRAGASTAKNALRGSDWTWSGASAGLRGAQSSLLGQPLRKYMVRARPRQPPGGPGRVCHARRPRARRPPPTPPPAESAAATAATRGICPGAGPGRADAMLRDAVWDADRPRVGEAGGQWARGGRSRGRPAPLAARVSTPHGAGRLRPAPSDRPASERRPRGRTSRARDALLAGDLARGAGDRDEATGSVSDNRSGRAHLHDPWIGATSGVEGGGASGARVT